MATDKYVNSTLEAGSKVSPGAGFPGEVLILSGTYEKTAADNDTSVLRLGSVPATAIPVPTQCLLGNDALTGATDVDIGTYRQNGAVIDADALSDGLNIAAGNALGSEIRAFQAIGLHEFGSDLRTLSGESVGSGQEIYDIAITGNTIGTATGTISWVLTFILPQ